jgi:hypothetical protein
MSGNRNHHHHTVFMGHNRPELSGDNLRCSDIGNAEVFADQHWDKLRYCFELGQWFCWDGSVWRPDAEAHLDELAEKTVRSFPGEASEIIDFRLSAVSAHGTA